MKLRMRTALWLVKRCKPVDKNAYFMLYTCNVAMYCCNAALAAGSVPHNDFHLHTSNWTQTIRRIQPNYRRRLQAAHKNFDEKKNERTLKKHHRETL